MVLCAKCSKVAKTTSLATPSVKKKSEMYLGSSAGSSSKTNDKSKTSSTLGNNGIGKSKLLSKAARNPYAAYSSSCTTCKTKVEQGRTYCQKCAYKANACPMCGKSNTKSSTGAPVISGQKFTLK